MVSYSYVQEKVNYGYGKCALKIGILTNVYRASNGINPLDPLNNVGQVYLSQNVSWNYMKANKFGNLIWQLVVDRTTLEPYDFLQNEQFTFYVDEMEPIVPTNGIECNRMVSLIRPNQTYSAGNNSYGGFDSTNIIQILQNCPVGILQATGKRNKNDFSLPLDTGEPAYIVYIPALPDVEPRIGDLMDDDRGVRIALTSVEKTSLGFRCLAVSVQV